MKVRRNFFPNKKRKAKVVKASKRKSIFSKKRKSTLSASELKTWSNLVRERDLFTCHSCGKKGKRLHAHHMISKARNPDIAYNVHIGITLCKRCHMGSHGVHGAGPPVNSLIKKLRLVFETNSLVSAQEISRSFKPAPSKE